MGSFAPGAAAQELLLPPDWDRAQFFTAIHWIQAVTATLSIMGSSSIIGYTIFRNTTRSPEVRPLVYLSLSDLFLGLCWLTGALFYSREASHPTREGTICYNLQATGQIFYVASFLYTVNYTWQLYMDLKGKFNQHLHGQMPQMLKYSTHLGRIAIVFSSLIPIFLMAPVLGLGNHFQCSQNFTAEHGCLLLHMENMLSPRSQHVTCTVLCLYSTGVFLVSFTVSFLAILTLLIRARMLYKRFVNSMGYVGDQQWEMLKVVEQAVALYPVVFFCCWGPAFILGIVKLARIDHASVYMALYVLEALTASSQGFLNCVVYGWTQHMFHCVKRKACRDVDTQTPLLRSQKRFYASTLPARPQAVAEPSSPSTTTVL
ncbi:transmembrane protein 116 isoform X1 [Pseudonaja textilis]|uniref:transmembrane protein 116 isoform X1 n=1 Tax=Pseudonaja textilis TaxID=8673 RepID=UPI000EAA1C40|nr:transmembrane protein 116 isoform X1 [Pseudonaja textilis]